MDSMTTAEKFDLIAPIAIWHHADVMFKKKAQRAFKKAQRMGLLADHNVDDANLRCSVLYNDLFCKLVMERRPSWAPFTDQWGAKGFKNADEVVQFSGDDAGFFPWYETAALLMERLGLAGD